MDNNVVNKEKNVTAQTSSANAQTQKETAQTSNANTQTQKETTKKSTKSKSNKQKATETPSESKAEITDDILNNSYALLRTFTETITKDGKPKEYLIGEFADIKNQICNVVIRPEQSAELAECDIGTVVTLDIQDVNGRKYAIDLKFIQKSIKKVAA